MVSVVVTTYNRNDMLASCLDSISKQTIKVDEVIIIDDASNENITFLLESFSNLNFIYHRMKINTGGNFALLKNTGIKLAKGEYITFCDDDDIWLPGKLERQLNVIKTYDAVCTNANIIDIESNVTKARYFNNIYESVQLDIAKLLMRNNILVSTLMINRKIVDLGFYFDEKIKNMSEDYEYYIRLSKKFNIFYLNEILASIRMHENFSQTNENQFKMVFAGMDLISPYLSNQSDELKYAAKIGLLGARFHLSKLYFKSFELLKLFGLSFTILLQFFDFRLAKYVYSQYKLRNRIRKLNDNN